MSSGNVYERLFKLGGTIAKLVMDGKRDPEKVADVFQTIVEGKTSTAETSSRSILRLIQSGLIIPATDGTGLLSEAKDLFPGWIDPDLTYYGCNVISEPKPETLVDVHELIEDGLFCQIFGGQGVGLDKLCLTQDQIIQFVVNHRQHLHPQSYATFFLFKMGKKYLVAYVYWHDARRLQVIVYRLAYDLVWHAESRPRVVLPASPELQRGEPQLTLKSS